MHVNAQKNITGDIGEETKMAKKNIKVVSEDYEIVEHPMSGYMGAYNTLKVVTEVHLHENGKFTAYVEEQMYCGDEEDQYDFHESDKEIRNTHESEEFDTEEEAESWFGTADCIDWEAE